MAFATSDNDLVLSVDDQETLIERDIKNYIAHIKWGNSSWDNVYFNASDNSEWNTSYKFNTNRQFLK